MERACYFRVGISIHASVRMDLNFPGLFACGALYLAQNHTLISIESVNPIKGIDLS